MGNNKTPKIRGFYADSVFGRTGTTCHQNRSAYAASIDLSNEDDPTCWHIDDQYYFGGAFLVAPVINSEGVRDVYLPAGKWVDFWTGKRLEGGCWLKQIKMPLERMPVYVKYGAQVPIYPHLVQCTDEMDLAQTVTLTFDDRYQGIANSILGNVVRFSE